MRMRSSKQNKIGTAKGSPPCGSRTIYVVRREERRAEEWEKEERRNNFRAWWGKWEETYSSFQSREARDLKNSPQSTNI